MEKITLTGVSATMLQTVYARAQETQKRNHNIAPVYRVIGRIPFVRNLSNSIVVLVGEGGSYGICRRDTKV